jgi:phospholipid/cholesterol/gamma-HCH transport system substrate-binding protein
LISRLTDDLGGVGGRLETLLVQSQKLLSDQNIETVEKILDNVEKVSARGVEVEEKVVLTLDEFRVTLAEINTKFTQAIRDFSEIKNVTVPTIDKLMQTSEDFNRATLKFEQSIDRGDYNLNKIFEPILVDIDILINQLNTMSRSIENNPSDLLFKSRKSLRGPGE